jgi:two-component system sensor histidine kinase KdpD
VLAATSQDVREQITEARAALSGIAAHDAGKEAARLAAAWRALHRIDRLAADLGALGRLHAGAQETYLRPVDVDEVLTTVIDDLGPGGHYVVLGSLEDLPDVIADAALLTRVLTSLLADALAHSPGDVPPEVAAACTDGVVRIRVTGGRHWTVEGLPIRLARDVAEAMGDTLTCEETPGAGLVAVITLPAAAPSPSPATPAACVP